MRREKRATRNHHAHVHQPHFVPYHIMATLSATLLVLIICSSIVTAFNGAATLPPRPLASIDVGGYGWRGGPRGQPSPLQIYFDDFSDLTNDEQPLTNGAINDCNGKTAPRVFPRLQDVLASPPISYPLAISSDLLEQFASSGFVDDNEIIQFARGFVSREEVLSRILIEDFGWRALDAHRARVGLILLVRTELGLTDVWMDRGLIDSGAALDEAGIGRSAQPGKGASVPYLAPAPAPESSPALSDKPEIDTLGEGSDEANSMEAIKPAPWKSVLVNDKAKIRRGKSLASRNGNENTKNGKGSASPKDSYNYGLLPATSDDSDSRTYPNLYAELKTFWRHMTVPQTNAVAEPPIREQTAKVYLTHARLFLGWMVDARGVLSDADALEGLDGDRDGGKENEGEKFSHSSPLAAQSSGMASSQSNGDANSLRVHTWRNVRERVGSASGANPEQTEKKDLLKRSLSLYDIFPTSQTESAAPILQYILWLRSERHISPNYEANILRGLIKLVKFRFASEMTTSLTGLSSSSFVGSKRASPLDDLPIVVELRKLHREAGNKGKKAPRSSDEGKKWLEWSEYLEVIQLLKADLFEMIGDSEKRSNDGVAADAEGEKKQTRAKAKSLDTQRKEIATAFQQYLILSFFACVPDRQRTYRELQLGRNFIRVDEENGSGAVWVIKHTADDYKTGSTYGERPPLPLRSSLTPDIDDFLERWRPALIRNSPEDSATANDPPSFLFLQPRTGNAMTANSVYQIVSRCCYKYRGKKTNPHLLRDMIVTHVRQNADASEKELEALALFMGHSIQMQRESYDRRTLEQKVSPAVKLMEDMNSLGGGMDE